MKSTSDGLPIKIRLTKEKLTFKYFFIVLSLFIGTWITADIAAIKLVSVYGVTLTGGFIIFPFTTMLGSIIVEVYGYKNARQAIWAGVILNITFITFIYLINLIPSPQAWDMSEQFKNILTPSIRIATASIISFLIAEFMNSYLMAKMKIISNGRFLIKRILISCCLTFLLDIVIFLMLAFYGTLPNIVLQKLIFFAYFKKVLSQLILFPLACYLSDLLKRKEGVDIYDQDTNFNPFHLDNVYEIKASKQINQNKTTQTTKFNENAHATVQ